MRVKKIVEFFTRARKGHKMKDKLRIFSYTMLHILLFPINRLSFLFIRRNVLPPKIFFKNFTIQNSDGLFFCRDNVDLDVASEEFEFALRKHFKELKKGVFIDIGANIGKYTVMMSNNLGGNGEVIAIEPHPENFRTLERNIDLNRCKNVVALNLACWNKKTELKLFSHEDQPLLASAVKPSENYIKTQADTLDNIIKDLGVKKIDLIKIDVEGAEQQVLEGMKNILKKKKARIIFEAWNQQYVDACRKILGKYGYEIRHLDNWYWLGFPGKSPLKP